MDKAEILRLLADDPEVRAAVAGIVIDEMRAGRLRAIVVDEMPRGTVPAWLARKGPAGDTT